MFVTVFYQWNSQSVAINIENLAADLTLVLALFYVSG